MCVATPFRCACVCSYDNKSTDTRYYNTVQVCDKINV